MKKILPIATFLLLAAFSLTAQNVNIPDPAFKNFLVNHSYHSNPGGAGFDIHLDSNGDGEIQYSEATNYPSDGYNHAFFLQGLNIHDLTGIEAFQAIQWINAPDNPLTSLNITGCLSLKRLTLNYGNAFTTLHLQSASLEKIDIACPTVTSVDLSQCPALKEINVSNNPLLTNFNINGCTLAEDLKFNSNTMLTSINMGSHYNLKLLQCSGSQINSLDVSSCHSMQYLFCGGNPLTSLNLANGNPQSFIQIIAGDAPDLTCITVDNVEVSQFLWLQTGGYYVFDEWATFSTDCTPPGPCTVSIPDANFKAKLLDNPEINTDGNTEIECTEAEAFTGTLNVDNSQISDMTGIKAFVNLTGLSCNNNPLDASNNLDVSGMEHLETVNCSEIWYFESLDLSGCTALTNFVVDYNVGSTLLDIDASGCTSLTGFTTSSWSPVDLNLSGCTALTTLDLSNKNLDALKVANCSSLTSLVCPNNQLAELSLAGCTALTALNCSNNELISLSLAGAPALATLNCNENELTGLNVLDSPGLTSLSCANNQLPYLVVSNNPGLTALDCNTNNIGYLDVNNNHQLVNLNCSHNNLNSLNVNSNLVLAALNCSYNNISVQHVNLNTALAYFDCSHNNINIQNVSSNIALSTFFCGDNQMESVDLSGNDNLRFFDCSHNDIAALDLAACNQLLQMNCSHNELSQLDLSAQTNLVQLDCGFNQLNALDISTTKSILFACNNNQLTSLNLANNRNTDMLTLNALSNPELHCIQVDDADFSTENWSGDNFGFDSIVSFSENCALGANQPDWDSFSVYPNPSAGMVYFTRPVNARLFSMSGQLLAERNNTSSLDVSAQPGGVYLITVSAADGTILATRKVVKL